ncbi:hypothetical protein HYH02_013739 [Chlamydomonas schloesseri]|uniref:Cytosol aminopeptidase domain-containing protein n=1 Tax=Chlamydomonas schloesseri TaxID=2026947 RepID=A0A835VV12_9CHLO|nr:hypothetical protein HYH02_013739 [Chlamydomonas schloesseri]|eukprot:KAG2430377.1 hypothetical protein HYH02_013739 [Chlamydomonas schloesseri]
MAQLLRCASRTARLVASSSRSVVACPRAAALSARIASSVPASGFGAMSSNVNSSVAAVAGAGPHRGVVVAAASTGGLPQAAFSFEPDSLPAVSVAAGGGGANVADVAAGWEGDLLVLGVTEEDFVTEAEVTSLKGDALKALDAALGGALAEIVAAGGFDGKQGAQSRVLRLYGGAKAKHVAMVGLGKAAKLAVVADWGASPFQALGAGVATLAKANKVVTVGLALLPGAAPAAAVAATALAQITSGTLLGGYEATRFKTKKSPTASRLAALTVVGAGVEGAGAEAAIKRGLAVARGNLLTRYLVESPPNVCTPAHLAATAAHIAAVAPEVFSLKVYEKAECEAMNMGLYLGVSEASAEPPKFIHLKYAPKGGSAARKIAIVGKGLTFDSGGYNLKAGPGSMIELMKFDMGGAGATLGAARILADLQPADVEVHFIIAACENMVAGEGLRPGDILTSASGKTVEVNNTDAEGRLTLADAMWFAQEKCGAKAVVDVATLTGACIVALGTQIAGLFTPSDEMAASLTAASKVAGEKLWRMPFENDYFDDLKSPVADMKNTGSRYGGAITAALFLKQFVNEGVEWAHVDVAGPVWNEKLGLPTGYGAAFLAEWALAQAQAPAK